MSVALALAALAVGVLIGASGIGGVLLIPALMGLGGLSTHQAMATAMFSFFFVGIAATWIYHRYGSLEPRMALPVLAGTLVSAYPGALVNAHASAGALNLILAAVIIGSSLYSLLPPRAVPLAGRLGPKADRLLLFGIGLFTGFLCGMTGAGGGIVSIPVMLLCGYAALPVIATGQALQSSISLSGSISHLAHGFVMFPLVWWVTLAQLAGIALGVRLAHAMPVALLKRCVGLLSLAIGLYMAAGAFSG